MLAIGDPIDAHAKWSTLKVTAIGGLASTTLRSFRSQLPRAGRSAGLPPRRAPGFADGSTVILEGCPQPSGLLGARPGRPMNWEPMVTAPDMASARPGTGTGTERAAGSPPLSRPQPGKVVVGRRPLSTGRAARGTWAAATGRPRRASRARRRPSRSSVCAGMTCVDEGLRLVVDGPRLVRGVLGVLELVDRLAQARRSARRPRCTESATARDAGPAAQLAEVAHRRGQDHRPRDVERRTGLDVADLDVALPADVDARRELALGQHAERGEDRAWPSPWPAPAARRPSSCCWAARAARPRRATRASSRCPRTGPACGRARCPTGSRASPSKSAGWSLSSSSASWLSESATAVLSTVCGQ